MPWPNRIRSNATSDRRMILTGRISILTMLCIACISTMACSQNDGETARDSLRHINAQELKEIMDSGQEYVLIDVRTPEEIADGKIAGALEIDYLAGSFDEAIEGLDKSKEYMLYCRSGKRSAKAGRIMLKNGFENVYNVDGGFNGWKKLNEPDE